VEGVQAATKLMQPSRTSSNVLQPAAATTAVPLATISIGISHNLGLMFQKTIKLLDNTFPRPPMVPVVTATPNLVTTPGLYRQVQATQSYRIRAPVLLIV